MSIKSKVLVLLVLLTINYSLFAQDIPEIKVQLGHSDIVNSVAFSPDGKYALSGSGDYTLKLWEVASGKELKTMSGHSGIVESVAFSPDGNFALSVANFSRKRKSLHPILRRARASNRF